MIIWIIIAIILVSAGLFIFLSGDDTADSSTPQYPATDPPITFSSNKSSVSSSGEFVTLTISYPQRMTGTYTDGITTFTPLWSQTANHWVHQTTTFTLSVFDSYNTYTRPITITAN